MRLLGRLLIFQKRTECALIRTLDQFLLIRYETTPVRSVNPVVSVVVNTVISVEVFKLKDQLTLKCKTPTSLVLNASPDVTT